MIKFALFILLSSYVWLNAYAHAHVMVEQHATLRFQTKGAYFLASYPMSAFKGVDDNSDGLLDLQELAKYRKAMASQVKKQVQLLDDQHSMELEGLLINLSHSHEQSKGSSHVIIMGRFKPVKGHKVRFLSTLFGKAESEQQLKLRITRHNKPIHVVLTPQKTMINIAEL